jgi:hypothetical protein
MNEQEEWEIELAENLHTLFIHSGGNAKGLVIDGASAKQKHGLVLISGGWHLFQSSKSTEIIDYTNDSVRKGPDMEVARYDHTSVVLPTGEVVVVGGHNSNIDPAGLASCEVFDVTNVSCSEIGYMIRGRDDPAAVSLPNGLVLIIGGYDGSKVLNSCEFYNPADKTFSASKATMSVGRSGPTASLLPNGKVLVCGGWVGSNSLQTTEIYDPLTDSFSAGPSMTAKRSSHTATTLPDGRVLLAGCENGCSSNSTEFYDPHENSFSLGPKMTVARRDHFSTLLPDGRVLIGGGWTDDAKQTTEIYDPWTNTFSMGLSLLQPRVDASACLF